MRTPHFMLVALLAGAIATGCAGQGDDAGAPTAGASQTTTSSRVTREPAPEIHGRTLEGEPISLADFRGRPVLVNVWSSW
jgi:hypothetical protein